MVIGECSGDRSRSRDTGVCRGEHSNEVDHTSPKDRKKLMGSRHSDLEEDEGASRC